MNHKKELLRSMGSLHGKDFRAFPASACPTGDGSRDGLMVSLPGY